MKSLIVANWKMHPDTMEEARALLKKTLLRLPKGAEVVLCPPTPFLSILSSSYRGKTLSFGAQDVSAEETGSHTGEYTASMLASLKLSHIILGHSERRKGGETSQMVAKKITATLRACLTPIVCVGETERDGEGKYLKILEEQMRSTLLGIKPADARRLVLAYEPVWAIGKDTNDALSPLSLQETILFIRKVMSELWDRKVALSVPILYGGSVTPENSRVLKETGGVAGFLVGHESLLPERFREIVKASL